MKFKEVHILFEQSGTFKKIFEKYGYKVIEYDIEKTENVDFSIDIFTEIDMAIINKSASLFDTINKDDLVIAFFPCTYFSDQNQLLSRGDSFGQKNWSEKQKLEYSMIKMNKRNEFFNYLCKLCIIAIDKGFKLIIENPYGKANFLKQFFSIKPQLVIHDRREYGDFYKKPTQFFFINCEPGFKLFPAPDKTKYVSNPIEDNSGFDRSRISPTFAENFFNLFIKE